MKFLTGDQLRDHLGLGNVDTIVDAADSAVHQATVHVANDLRTPLTPAVYSDLFLLQADDLQLNTLKLKLTAGFVSADTVKVGIGYSREEAANAESVTDFAINAERGVVTLYDVPMGRYIVVRYEAGLPVDDDDDTLFDPSVAPDWIKEAAKLKASQIMTASPEMDNDRGEIVNQRKQAGAYASLLTPHVRYEPMARNPVA